MSHQPPLSLNSKSPLKHLFPTASLASCAWLGMFCLCLFIFFHGGHFYHVDEELHFLVASSLLEGNGGAVPQSAPAHYRGVFQGLNDFSAMGKVGPDGRFYVKSGIGQALAALPLVFVGHMVARAVPTSDPASVERFVASLLGPALAAIGLSLLFAFLLQSGFHPQTAAAAVAVVGFTTFYFAQAKFFMNHMLVSTLLLAGLFFMTKKSFRFHLACAGLCCGSILLTRLDCVPYAMLIPLFGVLSKLNDRRHPLRQILYFTIGFAVPSMILAYANVHRFGSVWDLGHNLSDPTQPSYDPFSENFFVGFFGQWLNLQSGFIWFAPAIIPALLAVRRLSKTHRPHFWVLIAGLILPAALYARFANWAGEISWGPRFLLPTVPLIGMALAALFEERGRLPDFRMRLASAVLLLGLVVQLGGTLTDHNRGFLLTRARIDADSRYALIPYSRLLSQIELLGRRPPDLWWIQTWHLGGVFFKTITFVAPVGILIALIISLRRFWLAGAMG